MKKKLLFVLLLSMLFVLVGCGGESLSYNRVERDSYNTGGNVDFEYDESSHTAYFGGKGQFLEWQNEDIAKGWEEEGNRIGIKIAFPQNLVDDKTATATFGEEKFEYKDFIKGEENKYALFQPVVSEENKILPLKIKWSDKTQEQSYNIVIRMGTVFLGR